MQPRHDKASQRVADKVHHDASSHVQIADLSLGTDQERKHQKAQIATKRV